jgi:hypothetical protein
MMTLSIDAFRSGLQWEDNASYAPGTVDPAPTPLDVLYPEIDGAYRRAKRKQTHVDILFYVMHHYPGYVPRVRDRCFRFYHNF